MPRRLAPYLYAALAVAVAVWLFSGLGGEAREIERRLEALGETLEKDGAESGLVAANKARQVGLFFADRFVIDLGPYDQTVTERQRISQVMLAYRADPSRIGVSFRDLEIALDPGERGAHVSVLAAVTATTEGELSRSGYRLALRWVKERDEWRIERAEIVEAVDGLGFL